MRSEIYNFANFIFSHFYHYRDGIISKDYLAEAENLAYQDATFYNPKLGLKSFENNLTTYSNSLLVYLYRLGNLIQSTNPNSESLEIISAAMKMHFSSEIYFNNEIGVGFMPIHCLGTVIGSRNTIGKGFKIYQSCTIGHTERENKGAKIGDNFILYSGSSVLGDVKICNNVKVASNSLVLNDIQNAGLYMGLIK